MCVRGGCARHVPTFIELTFSAEWLRRLLVLLADVGDSGAAGSSGGGRLSRQRLQLDKMLRIASRHRTGESQRRRWRLLVVHRHSGDNRCGAILESNSRVAEQGTKSRITG